MVLPGRSRERNTWILPSSAIVIRETERRGIGDGAEMKLGMLAALLRWSIMQEMFCITLRQHVLTPLPSPFFLSLPASSSFMWSNDISWLYARMA